MRSNFMAGDLSGRCKALCPDITFFPFLYNLKAQKRMMDQQRARVEQPCAMYAENRPRDLSAFGS